MMRVLGAEHPSTLTSANNLAWSLKKQGKYAEAERIMLATLASLQRSLGPANPGPDTVTLTIARILEDVRAAMMMIG